MSPFLWRHIQGKFFMSVRWKSVVPFSLTAKNNVLISCDVIYKAKLLARFLFLRYKNNVPFPMTSSSSENNSVLVRCKSIVPLLWRHRQRKCFFLRWKSYPSFLWRRQQQKVTPKFIVLKIVLYCPLFCDVIAKGSCRSNCFLKVVAII